jgi:hypothetical protein
MALAQQYLPTTTPMINDQTLVSSVLVAESSNAAGGAAIDGWCHCGLTSKQKKAKQARQEANKARAVAALAAQENNECSEQPASDGEDCYDYHDYYSAQEANSSVQRGSGKKARGFKSKAKMQYAIDKRSMQRRSKC